MKWKLLSDVSAKGAGGLLFDFQGSPNAAMAKPRTLSRCHALLTRQSLQWLGDSCVTNKYEPSAKGSFGAYYHNMSV